MIEVGNIVTLENNQEYLILEELTDNEHKYVYSVRVLEDETPTDEYLIFESIIRDDDEFLKPVNDKELYDNLIEEFKDIVADKLVNGDYENDIEDIEEAA
ncbi:MAG: hypothetical protein J5982_04990 [Bacilli bacterium]|nr:hypothetical protein [Bacilli bacterium]